MDPLLYRIQEAMKAARMRPADLARALDIGAATISEWFGKGSLPSAAVLQRLPGALGVSGHWLLTGTGPLQPDSEESAQAKLEAIRRIIETTEADESTSQNLERLVGGDAARTLSLREEVRQTPAEKPGSGKGKRRARG